MEEFGIVTQREVILEYFRSCLTYGSLFVASDISYKVRVVTELKNINEAQEEISLIPLNNELLELPVDGEVVVVNESGNISFSGKVLKNHASKWITLALPNSLKVVNLRQSKRFTPTRNLSPINWMISYGEDGRTKMRRYEGSIIDISPTGVAFKFNVRRLDGLYRGDQVEMNISEKISSLSRLRGTVIHKSIALLNSPDDRFIKVGVKFENHQVIDELVDITH